MKIRAYGRMTDAGVVLLRVIDCQTEHEITPGGTLKNMLAQDLAHFFDEPENRERAPTGAIAFTEASVIRELLEAP